VIKYLKTNILYEDEYFVFINKESGILSIPDRFDQNKIHLKGLLMSFYPEIYVLHRLDQNTSGLMVFAKTAEAHKIGSEIFESRDIVKEYMALTINCPSQLNGSIVEPIIEHKNKKSTYVVSELGKESHTDYEVQESWGDFAYIKLRIQTGRTHQIRVHLAYIGCPLIVDPVYGYYSEYFLSSIKRKKVNIKKGQFEKPLLTRTPLHASRISFVHPLTQKLYNVECPIPKDIKAVKYQLDKRYNSKIERN